MRNRSNSGVHLDNFQHMVQNTILKHQHPGTGLLPATPDHPHAWVRDNLYSVLAVWGLALAYKKTADLDEDRAKAYELEQSVVKLMRGLLRCMMGQIDKVERFKYSQSRNDALHAKYCVETCKPAVGDFEWGHLQLDATSLYLLVLAEMTASGLRIVYTLDEVAFIQNLVFYIQAAYRTPDYGIWERGDKTNHGNPELNASSIGMAKAALEALNELDLYGARGGPASVIHVMPDEAVQCQAILQSMLPRESNSKETDAGLLSIISYPAFAVDNPELIEETKKTIIEKLMGRYGCCRFLRDGHKTPKEDPNRLHYEPWELQVFENIECEWPLFFAYLVLDGIFNSNDDQVKEYSDALDPIMVSREDGVRLMPELYVVPPDKVENEYNIPKSQDRLPDGKMPHMWGQSLYVLGRLLAEGFLSPGELDPLNRRLVTEPKPDLVVQVVILAEDERIQEKLAQHDLKVQTFKEVAPISVYPARYLSHIYAHLGRNKKLGLTGRPSDVLGVLATSKMYTLGDKTLVFMPQGVDQSHFYLPLNIAFLLDMFKGDIQFLGSNWTMLGRPLIVFPIKSLYLDINRTLHPALVATIKKLQTGYINGTRVQLGLLKSFVHTSCVTNLTFLTESEDSPDASNLLGSIQKRMRRSTSKHLLNNADGSRPLRHGRTRRKSSVRGIIKRTCSIQVDSGDMPEKKHHTPTSSMDMNSSNSSTCGSLSASPTTSMQAPNFFQPQSTHHPHLKGEDYSEASVHAYHDSIYEGLDCEDLVNQLKEAESLHEQADIIHYLFMKNGPNWETNMEGRDNGKGSTVKDLLVELYDKAGHLKQWWLVRHTAGMLHKKVEDLAKAATDILVRQKQLAVGLPQHREMIITRPLPPDELARIIHDACGDDSSTAMLTQEILVYLAMFIRTEPKLFNEMLRLRIGLIIQVMASELARTLRCGGEEASDQLLNLSPYEMKTLLHHILSGKEFGVTSVASYYGEEKVLRIKSLVTSKRHTGASSARRGSSHIERFISDANKPMGELSVISLDSRFSTDTISECEDADRQGQWLRRRRLDGALNRVPLNFYSDIWHVLCHCHGIAIRNETLQQSLTKEMTSGEIKFALQVEIVLNRIEQPEYRQLMVEGMMVLIMIVQHDAARKIHWHQTIQIDRMVNTANDIFQEEQISLGDRSLIDAPRGAADILMEFYDTAPSGRFGTMSYLCKAAMKMLHFPVNAEGNLDCLVS